MSVKTMTALACAGALSTLCACGEPRPPGGATTAPHAGDDTPGADVEEAPPQPRLAPGQIRVTVVVLPGDAQVEVDGSAVRRRDGIIELIGKAHEKRRLRVFVGALSIEQDVILETDGASPASLDLMAKAAVHSSGSRDDAKAPGQSSAPADPLLPESFE